MKESKIPQPRGRNNLRLFTAAMVRKLSALLLLLTLQASVHAFMPIQSAHATLGLHARRSEVHRPQLQKLMPANSRVPARLRGGGVDLSMSSSLQIAKTSTLIYAVLMGAGGIVAGLKAGSKPSIISGTVASIVLGYAYSTSNLALSFGTAVALSVVFAIRFKKTSKFMPAGLLGSLSVVFAAIFGWAKFG